MAEPSFNVLLGVSGSVASYRAADLARNLVRAGASVRVCLTEAGSKFVSAKLFEALTGNPVLIDTFEEPVPGRMVHIDWARWASVIVIAPATANTIAKLAQGYADNLLTTIASATSAPLVIAPAMNPQMYASEATLEALRVLASRGVVVVEPKEGDVACGEHGQGKLADIADIGEEVLAVAQAGKLFSGKKILITSGPTQEPIDSVRFLSNRSSGKMGAALTRAALLMGAEVTVVAGPSSARYALAAKIRRVETANEMLEASLVEGKGSDLIFGVAAVADFRPAHPSSTKVRRTEQSLTLELIENPDVIATLSREFPNSKVVAFAAEPSTSLEESRQKILRKRLFGIAANDISDPNIGFGSDDNELQLLLSDGSVFRSPRSSKLLCSLWLLKTVDRAVQLRSA